MPDGNHERWQVADLTIDVGAQTVFRDGEPLAVPNLSFRFLETLIRAAPNVVSIDELMTGAWAGVFVNDETVIKRAKLLRDSLGDDSGHPQYFIARRGLGYQMVAVPQPIAASRAVTAIPSAVGLRRWKLAAAALLAFGSGGPMSLAALPEAVQTTMPSGVRVAVLRFDNLSSDPADGFIARSIPEIVLDRLSSVSGLTVISRDSALLSPAGTASAKDAARLLGATFVVKGSIQRTGDTLRVTCFVIDSRRGTRIWSERFDWPVSRIYALQDRIADRVAASLQAHAEGLDEPARVAVTTRNTDAYLTYLKGKSLLGRFTVAETDAAAVQFEHAVKLDPGFADALVALFDAKLQGANLRKDDVAAYRARYQPLLDKALRISPDSGAALFAKAMWSEVPKADRIRLFRRAAELDPSNSRGLTAFAGVLDLDAEESIGTPNRESKALLDRVLAIDPLSPQARFWSVKRRWTVISPEQIMQEEARELAIDPQNYMLAQNYAFRRWLIYGETADAIEKIERVIASDPQNPMGAMQALRFYLDVGDPESARAVAATTPVTRASSRYLFAQYAGDWREARTAAFALGRHRFKVNWGWAEAVRDYALRTGDYDRSARAIAAHHRIDLANPHILTPEQNRGAVALGHVLLAKGDRTRGTALLTDAVRWIDSHPSYGMPVHMRIRAEAMMLLGERNEALSNLRASVEAGHDIHHWWYVVDRDPVWTPVRSETRFKAIAEIYRQAAGIQRAKLDRLRSEGKIPIRRTAGRT
ncbi:MAG TPA: winged helix-turn-helix domain-containing protein [Novosphingobium sp.]|nr:winged helix-turn-helix domain-containing protein [Novosphingobium sp.]